MILNLTAFSGGTPMNPRLRSLALVILLTLSRAGPANAAWQLFGTTDGLQSNFAQSIMEDRSGTYWVVATGGVSRYDGRTWSQAVFPNGQRGARVILQDHLGRFWIDGGDNGVIRFEGANWTYFDIGVPLSYLNSITSIFEDHTGNIWVGTTSTGVRRFDGTSWTGYTTADGLMSNTVRVIVEDHSGNMWFASYEGGVSRFDGTTWTTFTTPGLPSNSVNGLTVDHLNNVWFATNLGLTRFDGSTFRTFRSYDGLPEDYIHSVAEDRFGNIWAGTLDKGVSRFDGRAWRTYGAAEGVPAGLIIDIDSDHLGNVWLCIAAGGVARFDGTEWKNYPIQGYFGNDNVTSTLEDHTGKLWFGTQRSGLWSFDGRYWGNVAIGSGLQSNDVRAIAEGPDGRIWVATGQGASVLEGGYYWRTITTAEGLATNDLLAIGVDRAGVVWFGGLLGELTRFDGTTYKSFPRFTGNDHNQVFKIAEGDSGEVLFGTEWGLWRSQGDTPTGFGPLQSAIGVFDISRGPSGNLWFAAGSNAVRFDGVNWTTFRSPAPGGAQSYGIAEGADGTIWLTTFGLGISMLKGGDWRSFSTADGLSNNNTNKVLVDRAGDVWVGCFGVTQYTPDRVAPRTLITGRPAPITGARDILVSFAAAFGEVKGIEFSTRLDGQAWSPWGPASSWSAQGLADGPHTLEIQSRDYSLNVEPTPVALSFEVDGTPPAPVLASPAFGQVIRGLVPFVGSSSDARLRQYSVAVRPEGVTSWSAPEVSTLATSTAPVVNGTLTTWDTSRVPDGAYDILVSETDSLGLVGTDIATVIVDNHAPYADETAPARVAAATGGDVYTTNAETHLYFPPHAFAQDAVVMVAALDGTSVPTSLPSGGVKVLDGYEVTWTGALQKPARFTMSYAGVALPAGTLALYRSVDGATWERLGGTVDPGQKSLSLGVSAPGRYALFADNGLGAGTASLSGIAFTPRVFSPTGGFADRQLGISFRLGRPAPVTVKVFSRSGRLIREVVAGLELNAGDNLIRWDGTDRNGGYVVDGMYLVTVEALGHTETKTLAVVK
jgi:ligand-binding sensor domain-containing protein